MELLFGIDVQKKFSLPYAWDREKNCYIQKEGRFLAYTRNCEQKANIGIVKSTLKIPLRHNGIIPIKIKGHIIKGHTVYLISDQDFKKGKKPEHNIIDGIKTSKEKYGNILISTTPTNTSPSTKGVCRTSGTTYRRNVTDSSKSRFTNNPQYYHRKDDGQEG